MQRLQKLGSIEANRDGFFGGAAKELPDELAENPWSGWTCGKLSSRFFQNCLILDRIHAGAAILWIRFKAEDAEGV
jgi:hypothetical protein